MKVDDEEMRLRFAVIEKAILSIGKDFEKIKLEINKLNKS